MVYCVGLLITIPQFVVWRPSHLIIFLKLMLSNIYRNPFLYYNIQFFEKRSKCYIIKVFVCKIKLSVRKGTDSEIIESDIIK